jgi:hypothetical protein
LSDNPKYLASAKIAKHIGSAKGDVEINVLRKKTYEWIDE